MIFGMTYYQLCMYFLVYSFLGWCVEVVFHALKQGKAVNRGFLNGPVCPVYGFGMLAVIAKAWTLFYGYHRSDSQHAINNVRKMHKAGIPILGGTVANNVFFLPQVRFGTDLHTEMKLLSQCGLSNQKILQSVTSVAADGFRNDTIGFI